MPHQVFKDITTWRVLPADFHKEFGSSGYFFVAADLNRASKYWPLHLKEMLPESLTVKVAGLAVIILGSKKDFLAFAKKENPDFVMPSVIEDKALFLRVANFATKRLIKYFNADFEWRPLPAHAIEEAGNNGYFLVADHLAAAGTWRHRLKEHLPESLKIGGAGIAIILLGDKEEFERFARQYNPLFNAPVPSETDNKIYIDALNFSMTPTIHSPFRKKDIFPPQHFTSIAAISGSKRARPCPDLESIPTASKKAYHDGALAGCGVSVMERDEGSPYSFYSMSSRKESLSLEAPSKQ